MQLSFLAVLLNYGTHFSYPITFKGSVIYWSFDLKIGAWVIMLEIFPGCSSCIKSIISSRNALNFLMKMSHPK